MAITATPALLIETRAEICTKPRVGIAVRPRHMAWTVCLLALVAVLRIVMTYPFTSQGYDEPGHIAAGMEWLDRGTYLIDPYHPPMSRVAMALPLYLAGERLPTNLPTPDPVHPDTAGYNSLSYTAVGNAILYDSGHYLRNLSLARSGILPFFLFGTILVFAWTARQFGGSSGVFAVALFTTLPVVLAFSGLAYTDLPAAAMQCACIFVFTCWLGNPSLRWTALLGGTAGLAFLSKFTALVFLPSAALAIVICKWVLERRTESTKSKAWVPKLAMALMIALLIAWGGYRFSRGHIRAGMHLSPDSIPSFQHFPAALRPAARALLLEDPVLPFPEVLSGLAGAWVLNKTESRSYLLGKTRNGGWWYFFLVAIALKTPLPFLLLCLIGAWFSVKLARETGHWQPLAPLAAVLAILIVSTRVHYDVGLRHFLVLFPLLAVLAGCGAAFLVSRQGSRRTWGPAVLALLFLWQTVSSLRAGNDYISYFNELAASDPSHDLVTGCDLDCGQDLFRLSDELHRYRATHVSMAVWSTAELKNFALPNFDVLRPFQPTTGWVAISLRSLRLGDVQRLDYPTGAFAWLDHYKPVGQAGRTILLYYIPGENGSVHEAKTTVLPSITKLGN